MTSKKIKMGALQSPNKKTFIFSIENAATANFRDQTVPTMGGFFFETKEDPHHQKSRLTASPA